MHSIDELDEAKSNSSPEQLSKDQLLKSGKAGQVPSSLPSPHRSKNEIPAAAFKSFKAPEGISRTAPGGVAFTRCYVIDQHPL